MSPPLQIKCKQQLPQISEPQHASAHHVESPSPCTWPRFPIPIHSRLGDGRPSMSHVFTSCGTAPGRNNQESPDDHRFATKQTATVRILVPAVTGFAPTLGAHGSTRAGVQFMICSCRHLYLDSEISQATQRTYTHMRKDWRGASHTFTSSSR